MLILFGFIMLKSVIFILPAIIQGTIINTSKYSSFKLLAHSYFVSSIPLNITNFQKFYLTHEVEWDSRGVEDIRRQCIHHFAWTFVNKKAVFRVGATFAHSRSKTITYQWFRALFATVSMQQKGVFVWICNNGWNMDPSLHPGIKSAVN